MTSNEVREKFIKFFKAEPRSHKEISSAPLVPQNDPSTLFTSSGMQQLIPNLMGEPHPEGKRLVNSQPCIRVQDIEEVGDNRHTTFFEMLGNWSLGDYFKEEQLSWFFEFLTDKKEGIGLDPEKLYISVFDGSEDFEVINEKGKSEKFGPDVESIDIWKRIFEKVGIQAERGNRIREYPADKNWWSRSGTPKQMPVGEIGGPDSEVFYDFGKDLKIHEKSSFRKEKCHMNCECGRFLEVGNSVFIQYKKIDEKTFEELPQKNVDFGGGLERMVAAVNNDPDIFNIDVFRRIISNLEEWSDRSYSDKYVQANMRVIADHLRASVFLIVGGVVPSNKQRGYILRRLLRRIMVKDREINPSKSNTSNIKIGNLAGEILKTYDGFFGISYRNYSKVEKIINEETLRFVRTLNKGLKEVEKVEKIDGKKAFNLYQTYGFPLEITMELFAEKGQRVDKKQFEREFEKHKELSRSASAGMFKGGLADHSEEVTKLHTATHLLHSALRKILGEGVEQKGSNITVERLRFDFSHPQKLTESEFNKVENLINEQIEKDLSVSFETKTFEEAKEEGALAFFDGKYGEKVKVYTVGDSKGGCFSKEVCGGPHVSRTSEIGRVRIKKQEKIGAGLMRIYAVIG